MAMRGIASRAGRRPPLGPKAFGSRRSGRAGEPPEGVGKPCRCPASPAASLLPGGSPARSLWVIINAPWYNVRFSNRALSSSSAFGSCFRFRRVGHASLAWSAFRVEQAATSIGRTGVASL